MIWSDLDINYWLSKTVTVNPMEKQRREQSRDVQFLREFISEEGELNPMESKNGVNFQGREARWILKNCSTDKHLK